MGIFTLNRVSLGASSAALFLAAATFIAPFEGYRGKTYLDIVNVPTVCFGETDKAAVEEGKVRTFTRAECTAMLAKSLKKYDAGFRKCVKVAMPDSVYIAGMSLTYNVGIAAVCKSTFVRKINDNNFKAACEALPAFNRAGGQVVNGLVRRRAIEREECLKDVAA